jgi:FKBP-type peptidyl-prolyl cis-trans isomerase (trigger factor)
VINMAAGYTYKIQKGKDYKVDVEVEITPERFHQLIDSTYERLAKDVKLPGFRGGKAPRAQIEAKLGTQLLSETVKDAVPVIASEIVDGEKLSPITTLEYDVKEVGPTGIVKFSFSFTSYPEIKLGDLSKIKVPAPSFEVTEKDMQEVMGRLFKQPSHDHDHDHSDPNHVHEEEKPVEVTDEMAKELGVEGVKTVKELEERIRTQLTTMKENEAESKYETELLQAAVKLSNVPLPDALVDQQAAYLVDDYLARVSQLGVDIDGFLQAQGTSIEQIRDQKRDQAKQKLAQELVMNEIVKKYELTPEPEEIEKEINSIADPEVRNSYDNYQGRRYVLSVLIQRNSVQKLRELAGDKKAKK